MRKGLFAVVPAYNEADTIEEVVRDCLKYCEGVVVVDDGSKDKTFEAAKKTKAAVLRNRMNIGKGLTLKVGVKAAIELGAETIVCIDGDGQHSPEDIPKMAGHLAKSGADIVLGRRALDKSMPFIKRIGNYVIRNAGDSLFGLGLKDSQTGFKVFRTEIFPLIEWHSLGYESDTEIVIRARSQGLRVKEYLIKTLYTNKYKGTSVLSGVNIVARMLWWKLAREWA